MHVETGQLPQLNTVHLAHPALYVGYSRSSDARLVGTYSGGEVEVLMYRTQP